MSIGSYFIVYNSVIVIHCPFDRKIPRKRHFPFVERFLFPVIAISRDYLLRGKISMPSAVNRIPLRSAMNCFRRSNMDSSIIRLLSHFCLTVDSIVSIRGRKSSLAVLRNERRIHSFIR